MLPGESRTTCVMYNVFRCFGSVLHRSRTTHHNDRYRIWMIYMICMICQVYEALQFVPRHLGAVLKWLGLGVVLVFAVVSR